MSDGYITIDRQITNNWIWSDKPFDKARAWIDLLLKARWKDGKTLVRGELVEQKRGTVYCSMSQLADEWGWHRQTVKRYLQMLESDKMITLNVTKHNTAITIENYNKYQLQQESECTTESTTGTPSDYTSDCTSDAPHKKKEKKDNNIYINIYSRATAERIIDYLNAQCGTHYKSDTKETLRLINARLNDFTENDFYIVIDNMVRAWGNNPKMKDYLRPQTLFSTKFESYLNRTPTTGNPFADAVMRGDFKE